MRLVLICLLLFSCSNPSQESDIEINVTLLGSGDYSVIYDSNGATDGLAPIDINSYSEGDTIRIMDGSSLYKNSAQLSGWNLSPDGSGESYYFGQEITAPSGDLYLYGEW